MTNTDEQDDKLKLRLVSSNPWYIMMTLHGEQTKNHFDSRLHQENLRSWNKWIFSDLVTPPSEDVRNFFNLSHIDFRKFNSSVISDEIKTLFNNRINRVSIDLLIPKSIYHIDLSFYEFPNMLILDKFYFPGILIVSDCKFNSDFRFNGACVEGYSYFSRSVFSQKTEIKKSLFKKYTRFGSCNFSELEINCSHFRESIYFSKSDFGSNADFTAVEFGDEAKFDSVKITKKMNFSGAVFNSKADFSDATFSGDVDFSNVDFKRSISFEKAKFLTSPPNLHEAKLHSDTNWLDAEWPAPPPDRDEAATHVSNYQRLKQVMETLKKHEDELDFFAREMAAQRVVDGGWTSPRGFLNGLYALTSDYGRSVARPLALLVFAMWVAFSALVWTAECPLSETKVCLPNAVQINLGIGKALGLATTSAVGFLPFKKEIFGEVGASYSSVAHLIMSVQSLVSFGLLFLAGLALRNRFRMK